MPVDLIDALRAQLPPAGAELRLLDLGGRCGARFRAYRQDLHIRCAPAIPADASGMDAVVTLDQPLEAGFLAAALACLRPGGRLIIGWQAGAADARALRALEAAGFTRILLESQGAGALLRGERPHAQRSTFERVREGIAREGEGRRRGRYLHLLVRQTPNRPVWARRAGEELRWEALTLGERLLAFSSMPRAVNFMQPAVLHGLIADINKIGKFRREVARGFPLPLLLDPPSEALARDRVGFCVVDAGAAEAPDE